jgi:T5SS/PEP-CTERM-associated repeat protein
MTTDSFVRFDTNFGSFTVELFNSIAPATVANFLSYVESGSYEDSFFHRLVPGFVLQGGGYAYDATGVSAIPTAAPIANEFTANDPDRAMTIAMARTADPNSATDQFFFNLVDNSSTLGASNGGYAVFGQVTQGWNVIQTIAALPTVNAGDPFSELPVHDFTSGAVSSSNLVLLNDVVSLTPAIYLWLGGSGDFGTAGNWANTSTGDSPALVAPSALDAAAFAGSGGTITGTGIVTAMSFSGSAWIVAGQLSIDPTANASSPTVVLGAAGTTTGVTVSGSGSRLDAGAGSISVGESGASTLSLANGGTLRAAAGVVAAGSALSLDGTGNAAFTGSLTDDSTITSAGTLTVGGALIGAGALNLSGGLADIGTLAGTAVDMNGAAATLRVHAISGNVAVTGFHFGDAVDLANITGATLNGNTITAGGGTLTLDAAPAGYVYQLYGDAAGGTDVLLNPTSPPAGAVSYTDTTTGATEAITGDDYTGPVDYLQRQYVWSGSDTDNLAIRANVPNAFLKGGSGADALQAFGGNNVLDGGPGSNFLIGGTGADGGRDTFFVDARDPATVTWSTIVNFHHGDQATIFGFHPDTSTRPETASDGAGGFTGFTIHSEINGAGTGVNASMTFAGIDQATADAHFTYTTGTLPGNIDYLLIQYT